MSIKTYRESIIEAMILEMKRDEKVFVIGEDISGGRGCGDFEGEAAGGPMGLTQGLWDEFGAKESLTHLLVKQQLWVRLQEQLFLVLGQ